MESQYKLWIYASVASVPTLTDCSAIMKGESASLSSTMMYMLGHTAVLLDCNLLQMQAIIPAGNAEQGSSSVTPVYISTLKYKRIVWLTEAHNKPLSCMMLHLHLSSLNTHL